MIVEIERTDGDIVFVNLHNISHLLVENRGDGKPGSTVVIFYPGSEHCINLPSDTPRDDILKLIRAARETDNE